MPNQQIINAIKERLKQQLGYYERIYELTQEEKASLEQVDDNSLMKILNRKQKYLAKIDTLKNELLALKNQWEPIKASVDDSVKVELKNLTDKTEAQLKKIIDTEKENMQVAQVLKDDASKKVNAYKKGTNVVKSYLGAGRDPRRAYMDKKL